MKRAKYAKCQFGDAGPDRHNIQAKNRVLVAIRYPKKRIQEK